MRWFVARALAAFMLLFVDAAESAADKPERTDELSENTRRRIEVNPDKFIEQAVAGLLRVTATGVLTDEVVELVELWALARERTEALARFYEYDLDGDLDVDADEIGRQFPHLNSGHRKWLEKRLADADADKDGSFSAEEILRASEERAALSVRARPSSRLPREMMTFDRDADGAVTPAEIALSVEEISGRRFGQECGFPDVPDDAQVVLLSGYSGKAIPTVAVSGRDQKTTLVTLRIEKGDPPLFVVAVAGVPIVWELEGALDRIVHFVGGVDRYGAGVTGLPADRVSFVPMNCIAEDSNAHEKHRSKLAVPLLSARLRHQVAHVIGNDSLGIVALPSGAEEGPPPYDRKYGFRDGRRYLLTDRGPKLVDEEPLDEAQILELLMEQKLLMSFPRGVIELRADEVVASGEVVDYDVLPVEAGLLQLARQGAIERAGGAQLRIVKSIPRFPAGLGGGRAVPFLIAEGVDVPAGDPVHSRVVLEETGECISGCR